MLLGIPFILGVFGQEGVDVLSLLISVHLPTMMMASIIMFELFGRRTGSRVRCSRWPPISLRKIAVNPLIVGILCRARLAVIGLPLPALAVRFVDALAGIAGPLALFAMGLGLRRFGISGNVRLALVLSALKLFLMPAAALAMAWLLGLPPLSAKVAVAAAALPSGINSYLIAVQFGTGQALASNQMTIATALPCSPPLSGCRSRRRYLARTLAPAPPPVSITVIDPGLPRWAMGRRGFSSPPEHQRRSKRIQRVERMTTIGARAPERRQKMLQKTSHFHA